MKNKHLTEYLRNSGNELATVLFSAFCGAILSNNSGVKIGYFFETPSIYFSFLSDKHPLLWKERIRQHFCGKYYPERSVGVEIFRKTCRAWCWRFVLGIYLCVQINRNYFVCFLFFIYHNCHHNINLFFWYFLLLADKVF